MKRPRHVPKKMIDTGDIKRIIKRILTDHLDIDNNLISDTTDLYEEGIIDSLDVAVFETKLEDEFNIRFETKHFFDKRINYISGLAEIIKDLAEGKDRDTE